MLKKIVLVFAALALAKAQLPNFGWCPEYVPKANFDMNKFMGVWYEAERYFQITDVVSRCVTANYTRGPDGKIRVSNEVTNRFTGVKRILEGEIKPAASKSEEGKLHVKYTTVPLTPETKYSVLDTDYKNYAVLWSCSGVGITAQNAWLMTRQREAPGEVMQKAYGVLDKYGIWKPYFVKTEQADCSHDGPEPAPQPEAAPAPAPAPAPAAAPAPEAPVLPAKEPAVTEPEAKGKSSAGVHLRSASILPEVEAVDESRKEEPAVLADAPAEEAIPIIPAEEVRIANPEPVAVPVEKPAAYQIKSQEVEFKPIAPETIPEVILKVAESAKEASAAPLDDEIRSSNSPIAEESKTVEVIVPAESKPEIIEAPLAAEPAKDQPEIVEAVAPEEPKVIQAAVEELKPETAPIEEPKPAEPETKLAEEPKPVENLLATETAEESKPLEPLPVVAEIEKPLEKDEKIESPEPALPETVALKSAEVVVPVEAVEEIEFAEIPAVPEAPLDSTLTKALPVQEIEESKLVIVESAEPAEIPAVGAPLLKNVVLVASPETILEPVAPETPVAPIQPLKAIEVAAEESKAEVIAEAPKTLEAKP